MKKMVKFLLVFALIFAFLLTPTLVGREDVKYPDDRPICHLEGP